MLMFSSSIRGEKIVADCHFLCAGAGIGSSWLKKTILKDSLDMGGRLMVDANLRVKGHPNVFGIGDITDIPLDVAAASSAAGEGAQQLAKSFPQGPRPCSCAELKRSNSISSWYAAVFCASFLSELSQSQHRFGRFRRLFRRTSVELSPRTTSDLL